jgi:hypothetical protein
LLPTKKKWIFFSKALECPTPGLWSDSSRYSPAMALEYVQTILSTFLSNSYHIFSTTMCCSIYSQNLFHKDSVQCWGYAVNKHFPFLNDTYIVVWDMVLCSYVFLSQSKSSRWFIIPISRTFFFLISEGRNLALFDWNLILVWNAKSIMVNGLFLSGSRTWTEVLIWWSFFGYKRIRFWRLNWSRIPHLGLIKGMTYILFMFV